MICGSCGAENRAGRKFCAECGAALAVGCPTCGASNEPGEKFCGECGSALAEGTSQAPSSAASQVSSPAPVAPTAERRLVSVLFADLVGFTTISEARDSEEVRELLSMYFDTCRTIITRYGGTVEKFIGDAVMAVWGAPIATEDDAERAVRAALELTAAVALMGEEAKVPELRARAGVLTGEAAVNIGAVGEGMVAGDMVNTASRIQSAAEPGAVLVGESTKRSIETTVVFEPAGEFELKGKAGLTPLWHAVRVVAGARGTLKSTGLEPPFVGRDRELRVIKELYHASADEAKAHLVSVTGIAGIGKSRLSWEFYKYFDGLQVVNLYHRGRCISYGEGVAYWALSEMVKMRCRIAEEEGADSAAAKLRSTLESFVSDPEERGWIEPRLAHLLGLEERAAADKEDLFAAWRLFIERMSEQNPVVMIFEDLQWADAALLDFIEYLLEWSRNHRIFVLTHGRPELSERRPNWGAGKRNFTSLYLEPLSEEPMRALLSGVVPGLPDEISAQILDRAQGVPLYAVETVRMLLDRGLLQQEGNVYRPTGSIEKLEVPETLHALIAARLDGLAPEERRIVQDGAVLGKTFFKEGVARLAGLAEPQVEEILSALVRKEILSVQADPRSPERGQYGFLQDLLKTVAYETLSKHDRKAKHLAAAAFIQSTWAADEDEIVEVLASHYLRAYEAVPEAEDAAEYKARARDMLGKAGERAASLAAGVEALHYFEQAIELSDEPLQLGELHVLAGRAAWQTAHSEDATSHLERATAFFEEAGDAKRAAVASSRLAEIDWSVGRIGPAVQRLEDAFEVLSGGEKDESLAIVAAQYGRFLFLTGSLDRAAAPLELALELAENLELPEVLSQALNSKSMLVGTQNRMQESRVLLEAALRIALDHSLTSAALRAYNNLLVLTDVQDRTARTLELLEKALDLSKKVGDRVSEAQFLIGIAEASRILGRWDEAVALFDELESREELPEWVAMQLLGLAELRSCRGEQEGAETLLRRFEGLENSDDPQRRAAYRMTRARIELASGEHAAAFEDAHRVLDEREELGITNFTVKEAFGEALEASIALGDRERAEEVMELLQGLRPGERTPYLRAITSRFGAHLAAMRGEDPGPGLAAAAEIFRDLGWRLHLAVVLLESAEKLAAAGRSDEAAGPLEEARAIFEDLGARPSLERLDRVALSITAPSAEAAS
ncbi:MAG: AAA family ATPase [Actinomycetota bacterium]|nr:AAA family ATPase [Actinomycetota bacterium]